jgi:hypothetical protein
MRAYRLLRQEIDNVLRLKRRAVPHAAGVDPGVMRSLERDGVHVIANYWSASRCDQARAEIDRLVDEYRDRIWVDAVQSDHRVLGANRVSAPIAAFFDDEMCRGVVRTYERSDDICGHTLAAKLVYRDANPGSGGGWHRDRPDRRQTKAILYLSDVEQADGPFQYLRASHRPSEILRDLVHEDFEFNQSRFEDVQVDALVRRAPQRVHTITGAAGTLVLADTRGIHRGMPMTRRGGTRYALTNYYWTDAAIPEHIARLLVG